VIEQLDEPLRRVANSVSDADAATVRRLIESMEDTLERFQPDVDGELTRLRA
jgi:hypothetical protein